MKPADPTPDTTMSEAREALEAIAPECGNDAYNATFPCCVECSDAELCQRVATIRTALTRAQADGGRKDAGADQDEAERIRMEWLEAENPPKFNTPSAPHDPRPEPPETRSPLVFGRDEHGGTYLTDADDPNAIDPRPEPPDVLAAGDALADDTCHPSICSGYGWACYVRNIDKRQCPVWRWREARNSKGME